MNYINGLWKGLKCLVIDIYIKFMKSVYKFDLREIKKVMFKILMKNYFYYNKKIV